MTTRDDVIEKAARTLDPGAFWSEMPSSYDLDLREKLVRRQTSALDSARALAEAGLLRAKPDTASSADRITYLEAQVGHLNTQLGDTRRELAVARATRERDELRRIIDDAFHALGRPHGHPDDPHDTLPAIVASVVRTGQQAIEQRMERQARIDKALALHRPDRGQQADPDGRCFECGEPSPCPTREALASPGDPAEPDRASDELEVKREAVREARRVISQYLATAEKWRYDRVMWAFAIMLGEIPEDTPCPLSPADEEELRRRGVEPAPQAQRDALVWAEDDPEPPVGTVGRNRNGRVTWTRKDDGWHCGRPGCPACPTNWAEVTGWGGPLVEVIEPAPPQDDTTPAKPWYLVGDQVTWEDSDGIAQDGTIVAFVHSGGESYTTVENEDGEQYEVLTEILSHRVPGSLRPARDTDTTEEAQ